LEKVHKDFTDEGEKQWLDETKLKKNIQFEKFFSTQYKKNYNWDEVMKVFNNK